MSAEDEEAKMATEEFVAEYSDEHKIRPYSGTPKKDGVASAGDASTGFACGDHVHPTDTSRMAASATGADIAVSGSDPTKISVALAGKADSATTYTKDEVDEIVASVKNGSRQIVASLNDVTDPKPLVIYMVAKQSAQTKNAYDEYIWTAADAWEKIGDTEIDLSGYVPKETGKGLSTNDYTTEEKTKLEGIEAGAQANIIETVKVNGAALTPQDKAVNIPVPTLDNTVTPTSGNGVKSSGIWSAIWGALAELPTGFSSLYDWVVAQLAGKASEAEAEALRTGKQNALSAQQLANIAAVSDALAFDATHSYAAGDPVVYNGTLYTFTSAHTGAWTGSDVSAVDIIARLAGKLDKSGGTMTGNLTVYKEDGPWAEIKAETAQNSIAIRQRGNVSTLETDDDTYVIPRRGGTFAMTADIPYDLVTKTISNGAVTLDDRAINAVAVSSSLASLTVNFPTATSGKARDFGLRLTVASGVTTAPELALPQGVVCENADGEAPEIGADGAATILYFTETASGVFLVKGETLTAITQA